MITAGIPASIRFLGLPQHSGPLRTNAAAFYNAAMNLTRCIPKNKYDFKAIERARLVGFPALNPVIPELLAWLRDMNWPVAKPVSELLSVSGAEIVPHIRAILLSDDAIWKFWILTELCPNLSPATLEELGPDVARLARNPTPADTIEGADDAAKVILLAP